MDDDSLVAQYIRAIENPDSLGYRNGIWTNDEIFDPNNRGFGIDIEKNKEAAKLVQERKGKWITEEEERELRLRHIDYSQDKLEEYTPKIFKEPISENKKVMATGMIYRGDSVNGNPSVRDAYYYGTDKDMQKAVSDYYKRKGYTIRAEQHNKFFSSEKPKQKKSFEYIKKQEEEKVPHYELGANVYKSKSKLFSGGGSINNPWDNLSMKEKAEMMKVAIGNGITSLSEIRQAYNEFAKGGPLKKWTLEDEAGYRYWRSKLPKNLRDTNENDYDMRAAYKAGAEPRWNEEDKSYHLSSRDPNTGRIFKAPHHPTYLEALVEDAKLGYYPTIDSKGNTYTETWEGNTQYPREIQVPYKAYGGNLFSAGGNKSSRGNNVERAMNYLISKGMSKTGAAAIVGTLQAESSLDPTIHAKMKGDDGEGLAQWTGSRKNNFWKVLEQIEPGARRRYGSISNVPFDRQIDVVLAERPDVMQAISNSKDVATATDLMLRGFENGGGTINSLASKAQMDNIYSKWGNGYNKQMLKRLNNASNILGINIDPSTYEIPQSFFDNIDSQITIPKIGVQQDIADIDPEFRYKQPVIDETLLRKKPVNTTSINDIEEDGRGERLQKINTFNTIMGLMGQTTPLSKLSNTSTPGGLLSYVEQIYS